MLVSFHVPRCHGIDTITGVVQAYVFYLIGWIKREDCQQTNNRKTKLTKLGGLTSLTHMYIVPQN